ncbi:ELL-associated factor 2 isoform X1 [Apodemus sylvaticus]|uniref:ELL-associated factor 2 isoform X1 n=2 Tax=Apodemus sylvaticus TaxID=10129 RepID=UPI002244E530|nr:ELL-associated factor 2 isoform X1 [Apodemus sylvaticus]XP_052014341.1 ELL-associated factor 2 isoform X2 [Apodemus sylvaticus]XP_052014342.1 ELL-associated factor 2 isoform X1 [Apodemus sylvaticus]XP_052014343.1 ELL-associated factor 2 isoform X1 [Apodemus sylvaticus]
MNGPAGLAYLDRRERVLKLGESFEKQPRCAFHTVRYDFKPASIDTSCEGNLEVGKGEQVTITLPNIEGSTPPVTVFKGSKRPYLKECILIINHDTGECRLEKLSSNITVKKTRVEGSSKIQYRLEKQQQQMWNLPRTSNLVQLSPSEDKMSPMSLMDDIERELKAEASLMDQMSSCDSSSDSKSSSSSSSEDSSSDSEDDDQSSPSGPGKYGLEHPSMSARSQYRTSDDDATCNRLNDNNTLLMSTLRSDLQLSESESDSED